MTHPSRETWMAYLYGEVDQGAQQRQLRRHLTECVECRAQLTKWTAVGKQLDQWPLPPRRAVPVVRPSWITLAAAAVVVLAAGVALGRYSVPTPSDLEALRTDLREEFRKTYVDEQEMRESTRRDEMRTLLAEFARLQEQRRQEDLTTVAAALDNLEARHTSDNTALRRDLETVAVLTEAGFRQTQDQMVHLASLPPGTPPLTAE